MSVQIHVCLLFLSLGAVKSRDWNDSPQQNPYVMNPSRNDPQYSPRHPLENEGISLDNEFPVVTSGPVHQIAPPQHLQQQRTQPDQRQLWQQTEGVQEPPEDENLQRNSLSQTSERDIAGVPLDPDDFKKYQEEREQLLEQIKLLEEANRNLQLTVRRTVAVERNATSITPDVVDTLDSYNEKEFVTTRPVDCADHLVLGATHSGVYNIYPFTCVCNKPTRVHCDMETDGGGWTVLLTRQDQNSPTDFNRTWTDYKFGFGDPSGEYWIGNEHLHSMTTGREYTLRLDLVLNSGLIKHAIWNTVTVANEVNRYKLALGSYSGESTTNHNCFPSTSGQFFSTYDRDYDGHSVNCAMSYGGFWHYQCSNVMHPTRYFGPGIPSTCYSYQSDTATFLQLKIRPSICGSTFKTVYLNSYNCDSCH